MDDLIDVTASRARAQLLCITTAASSCGRSGLEAAIAHASQRASALGVRQTVRPQSDSSRYYLITSAPGSAS